MPRTFDPKEIHLTIGAPHNHEITGYAADSMLLFELNSDQFNVNIDAYGRPTRYKIYDDTATLTLTLTQASPSSTILSLLSNLDIATSDGLVPFMFMDLSSNTTYFSPNGFVSKVAPIEYANDNKNREWIITLFDVTFDIRGIDG